MVCRPFPLLLGWAVGRGESGEGECNSSSSSLSRMTLRPPLKDVRVAEPRDGDGDDAVAWIGSVEVEATQVGRGLPLKKGRRERKTHPRVSDQDAKL